MFEIILDKFFGPKNYLPPFYFSSKLNLELVKTDLEFLTKLFLQSATKSPPLSREDQMWFLEEIATCQRMLNPESSYEERVTLLQKIVAEFEEIKEKR